MLLIYLRTRMKVAKFSWLAAFTIEFVKIPPTSTDIVAIKWKFAEERTSLNSTMWSPKGRYRGIQSGKSRADRYSRAEGLRNGRSGFMAALNPNERSFPPPTDIPATAFHRECRICEVTSTWSAISVVPKNSRRFYSSNREGKHLFHRIPLEVMILQVYFPSFESKEAEISTFSYLYIEQ